MAFRFDVDKTAQVVAALLHFHSSKEMSYLRMLKLLYLADRETLAETGRPITGDHAVAMKFGPVLSCVYDLIKGEHTSWPFWSRFFQKKGYRIELLEDPGNGRLSKHEIRKLRDITEKYASYNEWDLVELTHELPEWIKNDPGNSCAPIPLDDVIDAVGRSADRMAIHQDAYDKAVFDKLFSEGTG